MYKKFLTALILTAAAVCTAHTVFAVPANEGRIVKVGISDSGFKDYYFNNISVSATDNFRLTDNMGLELLPKDIYEPYFSDNCNCCGSRNICNGCSKCGKCR